MMQLLRQIYSNSFIKLGYALVSRKRVWLYDQKLLLNSLDKLPIKIGSLYEVNQIKCNQAEV